MSGEAPEAPARLVLVSRQDRVLTLTLNRPERKNALTPDLNRQIILDLEAAAADASVGAVVLTGAGGAFSSGLDLRDGLRVEASDVKETGERLFNGLILAVHRCPKPVIAAVDGPAFGFGMGLAMAADVRYASRRARFAQSFARIGLCTDGGGSWLLQRLVGPSRALELIFTAAEVSAEEALAMGLCSRVLPEDQLLAEAQALAARIAAGPPLALARSKELVLAAQSGSLEDAVGRELSTQLELMQTADFVEGISAFMSRRPPRFTGT